jgi:DivIVA domain-containing protein
MTLSLDDVRNKRFRMARKSGYEVLEVDEFVDEVEETFGQLLEENANLKKQVDALKSSGSAVAGEGEQPVAGPKAAEQPASVLTEVPAPSGAPTPVAPIVVTTSKEASSAVVRLVELSTDQAEQLVREANEEAGRIRAEASRDADEVTTEARNRAERLESEARVTADRLQADAVSRTENLDRELATRRTEMFGDLEHQRDTLTQTVSALREFEVTYRSSLAEHLKSQLEALDTVRLEPAGGPEVRPADADGASAAPTPQPEAPAAEGSAAEGGSPTASDTPRLDALLGDQR